MKIGPFTPPDVREAILWDQEHAHELPTEFLTDKYLFISGFSIRIAAHAGVKPNFVHDRFLSPFEVPPLETPDFTLLLERVEKTYPIPEGTTGNVTGIFESDFWRITAHQWQLHWQEANPKLVTCQYCTSHMAALSALRLFLAHQLLLQSRGLLLHASAALKEGRTFVFLGQSGAGKSTSVYHSPGKVLSDEIVAILLGADGKLFAFGTPFGGEHFPTSTRGCNPEFFFIEKSEHNARKSISTRNAVARLLSQVVLFPFAPLELWDSAAEMVECIIENYPVEILEAKKDGSFWKELFT